MIHGSPLNVRTPRIAASNSDSACTSTVCRIPRTSANETAQIRRGTGEIVAYSLFILPIAARSYPSVRLDLMAVKVKGRFIGPMLLLRTDALPNESSRWEYQLKFDGYRAIAFKTGGKIYLRSRNDNDFSNRYSDVLEGLAKLPDETVMRTVAADEKRSASAVCIGERVDRGSPMNVLARA
jgi:ATP-dependent DNA ligase